MNSDPIDEIASLSRDIRAFTGNALANEILDATSKARAERQSLVDVVKEYISAYDEWVDDEWVALEEDGSSEPDYITRGRKLVGNL